MTLRGSSDSSGVAAPEMERRSLMGTRSERSGRGRRHEQYERAVRWRGWWRYRGRHRPGGWAGQVDPVIRRDVTRALVREVTRFAVREGVGHWEHWWPTMCHLSSEAVHAVGWIEPMIGALVGSLVGAVGG